MIVSKWTKMIVPADGLEFICDVPMVNGQPQMNMEVWRAQTLLEKEPGTIKWLQGLREGDVFYDIGASTGIYSLYAARLVGKTGHVYAFEPHVASARSLLQNIRHNKMQDRVTVLTCALHDGAGLIPFNYQYPIAGSSGSQLGNTHLEKGGEFEPWTIELKWATTIDLLIGQGLKAPTAVKMDVDGNEPKILQGMRHHLHGWKQLRSIQVEIHPQSWDEIKNYLAKFGYHLDHTHYTKFGAEAKEQGQPENKIFYNAVFERAPQ